MVQAYSGPYVLIVVAARDLAKRPVIAVLTLRAAPVLARAVPAARQSCVRAPTRVVAVRPRPTVPRGMERWRTTAFTYAVADSVARARIRIVAEFEVIARTSGGLRRKLHVTIRWARGILY